VFAAKSDGKSGGYAFSGQGAPGRLLEGLVGAKRLASPRGFSTSREDDFAFTFNVLAKAG